MDRGFRDIEREYARDPSEENFLRLLHYQLRRGEPIELTNESVNEHWDSSKIRDFLITVPKMHFRVCGYELVKPLASRTYLLAQLHNIIAQEFNFLRYEQGILEATSACNGEFSIMNTGFSPNGAGAGRFYITTLFNDGYAESFIDFECEDHIGEWSVTTEFVDYWLGPGLEYNELCDIHGLCSEEHIGTDDHVNEVDAIRADTVSEHYNFQMRTTYEGFIDLKLRGY